MTNRSSSVTATALALFDRSAASIVRGIAAGASAQVEEVHQLRVGTKRIRAVLGLARAVDRSFDGGAGEKMLRRIFRAAAALRDADVQLALAARIADETQIAPAQTVAALTGQRAEAVRQFAKAAAKFDIARLTALREAVESSLSSLDERAAFTVARATLSDWYADLAHTADDDLHDVRKRTKRAHALSWILAKASTDRAFRSLEKRLDGVQKLLGEWHDLVVAASLPGDDAYRQETLRRTAIAEKKIRTRFAGMERRGAFRQRI